MLCPVFHVQLSSESRFKNFFDILYVCQSLTQNQDRVGGGVLQNNKVDRNPLFKGDQV